MELTLGPILFDWKREEVLGFYERVAEMPVDRVYLGEVVCVKRGLRPEDLSAIGSRLRDAGKEVVLSSLAVVSNEEELDLVRAIARLPFPVEANDMSLFNMVQGKEVVAGPHITTYNVPSIDYLRGLGVKRVVFPVELSRDSMAYNIQHTGIEAEVFAHGKVPLAFSWRCYTSRAYGLKKSNCRYDCRRFPDGMVVKSVDGEPLFTVNGTSILSALTYTLVEFVEDLKEIGVKALRVSPQASGTEEIVHIFRERIEGRLGPEEGLERIRETAEVGLCNGWYLGREGKGYYSPTGLLQREEQGR